MKRSLENLDPVMKKFILDLHDKREILDKAATDLQEMCSRLKDQARRTKDDGAAKYVMIANSHHRYSAAVQQGLKRTSMIDRVLDSIKLPETNPVATIATRQPKIEKQTYSSQKVDSSFYEVYGELLDE